MGTTAINGVILHPEPQLRAQWRLNIYPLAGEASGGFVATSQRRNVGVKGAAADPDRAKAEAARRARGMVRRYCAENMIRRLGTLTYAGEGCHEPKQLRADVAQFFRNLRRHGHGYRGPYVWVPEWHPGGHGLHVHFGVGGFVQRSAIEESWGRGFVHIKLLGELPVKSGMGWSEARQVAGYLSKYVSKNFDDSPSGLHRYELAQGHRPSRYAITANTREDLLDRANQVMRGRLGRTWFSEDEPGWQGPPSMWLSWDE